MVPRLSPYVMTAHFICHGCGKEGTCAVERHLNENVFPGLEKNGWRAIEVEVAVNDGWRERAVLNFCGTCETPKATELRDLVVANTKGRG